SRGRTGSFHFQTAWLSVVLWSGLLAASGSCEKTVFAQQAEGQVEVFCRGNRAEQRSRVEFRTARTSAGEETARANVLVAETQDSTRPNETATLDPAWTLGEKSLLWVRVAF